MYTNTKYKLLPMSLITFTGGTNVTGDSDLSPEMKTYYERAMIMFAAPAYVHGQFGQTKNIPARGGKTIEFRRANPLPVATTPLTEGVTPTGQKMKVESFTAEVHQYGGFVEISDVLKLTTLDDMLVYAAELLGDQAGHTLDQITREILNAGTNVQYGEGTVETRGEVTSDMKLTVNCIERAVRNLKVQNAKPMADGRFVAIIHPDCAYDLMQDPHWREPKTYVDTQDLYYGELGMVANVRFVENTEAKIFEGEGAAACDVYSTLIFGKDAYGVTSIEGGGLQFIAKQLGSAGTADPLDQRATSGWKALHTAEILTQTYMIRVETGSTFGVAAP